MKKGQAKAALVDHDGMRAEYDFTGGVRGKHSRAMQAGYTITIHKPDGGTVVKDVKPKQGAVLLARDVQQYFTDSESVNAILRSLIRLIPKRRTAVSKKAARAPGRGN